MVRRFENRSRERPGMRERLENAAELCEGTSIADGMPLVLPQAPVHAARRRKLRQVGTRRQLLAAPEKIVGVEVDLRKKSVPPRLLQEMHNEAGREEAE